MVAILNELGKFNGADMSNLIFNISEGSDIKRLNTQLRTILSEGFSTVFISSGEMSLLGRCKSKLEGLKNRILEITTPLTDDADHSRRIKEGCVLNNGFAAPMIAECICNHGGYQYIKQLHTEALNELTATAPSKISGRFVEKFPTFLVVTAKIAEEALGIKFNIKDVVEFCYQCALKSINDDGDVDASYQDIIGECGVHRNYFFIKGQTEPQTCWGAIKYPNKIEGNKIVAMEYGIKPFVLKEMLQKHGHPNIDTCIAKWKKAGVLNHEKGKNTRDRQTTNVKNSSEELYVLKVYRDYDLSQAIGTTDNKKKVKPTVNKNLLKDDDEVIDNNENTFEMADNTNNEQEVTNDEGNNIDNETLDS